jgi:hypothetical protein
MLSFFTSGEAAQFKFLMPRLLGENGEVRQIDWAGNDIHLK